MENKNPENSSIAKPSIHELGEDLLVLSNLNLLLTIATPLFFCAAYFVSVFYGQYVFAILSTIALSYTSYGSSSHDFVHMNLRLPKWINEFLLFLTELICLRSGHAYRLSHLHHHRRFPHDDDIEGAASKMSLFRTGIEGIIFQAKITLWALKNYKKKSDLIWMLTEISCIAGILVYTLYSLQYTYIYAGYCALMIMGSWIIPFITSYLVHIPGAENELKQTRLFRGSFFSLISFEHLYHLEHHMYPMVPHKNWPELARRLDPYFEAQGIKALRL